jgi:hypothetical protein
MSLKVRGICCLFLAVVTFRVLMALFTMPQQQYEQEYHLGVRPLPLSQWGFGVRPAHGICGTGLPENRLPRWLAANPVRAGCVEVNLTY